MSELTVQLLEGQRRRRQAVVWPKRFEQIAAKLVALHGVPSLGNFDDPVQEIVYILLSSKTADAQYRRTHAMLTAQFPSLQQLAEAPRAKIAKCIESGGLGNAKADRLKRIARTLITRLGSDPAARLRQMSAQEVYSFLTALPGLGPKSAFCVMMCSLNFDVFPVDVNVSRIAVRLGAVPAGLKHYEYQKRVPSLIPNGRSKELHVSMVVHGRTICLPKNPKCTSCPIRALCSFGKRAAGRDAPLKDV